MNSNTKSYGDRDIAHLLHGYTDLVRHRTKGPLVITRGEGVRIFDESGKAYIEAAGGMWCTSFGFNDQELVEAATKQMRRLPYYHTLTSRSIDVTIELAERLSALVPIEDARIYFALSGSEANDFLIKFLWYYNNALGRPDKKKVIAHIDGYHGATIVATSLTGVAKNHQGFDLPLPGFLHVEQPNYRREGRPGESPEAYATRLADALDQLILDEDPSTIMAFMAEPCAGAGGVVLPPPTYFEKVQAVLRRHDILFLADEVITGLGRTGNLFGCETFGIDPDSMTLAKGLSSGYQPISALVLSNEIFEGLVAGSEQAGGSFAHGTTHSGHPVGAAVALRVLELMEERQILAHVKQVSPHFLARLKDFENHALVHEVRGVGLLGAVELVSGGRGDGAESGAVAQHLKQCAEDAGVIVRVVPCGESVAFAPPLVIDDDEIDELFDRFAIALDATVRWLE